MSHVIRHMTYPCAKSEKSIMKELNKWAYCPYESSGYHGNMTFHRDIVCKNEDDAEAMIKKLDRGWYDDHAVMFKDGRRKFWKVKVEWHE